MSLPQRRMLPVFPLHVADFIARGIEKGRELSAALCRAEEAWIEAGFSEDKAALNRIAASYANSDGKNEKPGG